jgi:glycosyltransferase involved in cell wall biosynthesis
MNSSGEHLSGEHSGGTVPPPLADWSVMIPTYRPDETLKEALLSALAALDRAGITAQVEVVDDASPEMDVSELLRGWGMGGVNVYRRTANGGLGDCWNTCIERSTAPLVHILHQDDAVHPDFYSRMTAASQRYPSALMLFCRTRILDNAGTSLAPLQQEQEGLLPDWLATICSKQTVYCPAVVVRRATYEAVGVFDPLLRYIIDWEMWIRIAAAGPVAYLPEPLVSYRVHEGSESGRLLSSGQISNDFVIGIQRIRKTLLSVGRRDCLRLAVNYACVVSGAVTWGHEAAGRSHIAARELLVAFKHFWWGMTPSLFLKHLKRYVKLRLQARREMRSVA